MTEQVALIVNPSGDYAAELISFYWRQAGIRSVLAFEDRHSRRLAAIRLPIDHSRAVARRVQLPPQLREDPAGAARQVLAELAPKYEVRVVPTYLEHLVGFTTAATAAAGLEWNTPAQMGPLRDKFALKELLRDRAPQLRMNASMAVETPDDVFSADPEVFSRFVLKPRSGLGNRDVLIRPWPPDRDELTRYFGERAARSELVVLEEVIDGQEYQVNGQVDAAGQPTVTAAYQTNRRPVGQRSNMASDFWTLPGTDPRFTALSDYAAEVMGTLGLARTPFHMELKLDDEGPCLIEVGARFIGGGGWHLDSYLHGPQCDLVAVAAHDWLTDRPRDLRLDWRRYDSLRGGRIYGSSDRQGRIKSVHGVHAISSSPGFVKWNKQPQSGQVVTPTVDTASTVWAFELATPDPEEAQALWAASQEVLRLEFVEDDDRAALVQARGRRATRLTSSYARSVWHGRRERR
ncbi:MAG: ATP-grasp domain-containing protein [Actinobacteria bacterium]|nr:MAG: ATP-grasp domain-containing protein [Actinomycetota bacterium]